MSDQLTLIGCVKTKRRGVHRAADLYNSPLFRGRRAYAEHRDCPWFILSAKHGLLHPDEEVEYYDATLKHSSVNDRRAWSARVLGQLEAAIPRWPQRVEVHAGVEYREYGLADGLREHGCTVDLPLQGLGLGQQLAWYKRQNSR